MDYRVELDIFRGPLDLLLYLVKRNEVEIADIPIAQIAQQYLQYLEVIKIIDFEQVGEFLVLAGTLMEIKSRMLLPRIAEQVEEEDDPRLELVRQLVEYKKYKDAAERLEERAAEHSARFARERTESPNLSIDPAKQPIREVEIWDLVSAFGRLMRETLAVQPKEIVDDETPIQVHMDRIIERLAVARRMTFVNVFEPPRTRGRLVGIFLALLELMKVGRVAVEQPEEGGEIEICIVELESMDENN